MALSSEDITNLHSSTKTILEIWMRIKLAIQTAFRKVEITKEHEHAFLQLKSDLSRKYRSVSDKLPAELQFDGDDMIDLMKNATTMKQVQTLPMAEKRNIFSRWHKIYVLINQTFGALEVMNEGFTPRLHRDLLKMDYDAKKKGKKKKKKK